MLRKQPMQALEPKKEQNLLMILRKKPTLKPNLQQKQRNNQNKNQNRSKVKLNKRLLRLNRNLKK